MQGPRCIQSCGPLWSHLPRPIQVVLTLQACNRTLRRRNDSSHPSTELWKINKLKKDRDKQNRPPSRTRLRIKYLTKSLFRTHSVTQNFLSSHCTSENRRLPQTSQCHPQGHTHAQTPSELIHRARNLAPDIRISFIWKASGIAPKYEAYDRSIKSTTHL